MKRFALATLTAAIALGASTAQADSRYDDDDRYDDDRYGVVEHRNERIDRAEVVSVDPIVDRSQRRQRQECWREPSYRSSDRYDHRYGSRGIRDERNVNSGVVGGIIGGVLGNQVGKGDGRKAATAAGAVIGYQIGKAVARQDDRRYGDRNVYRENDYRGDDTVQRCRNVDDGYDERVIGYNVTYRYGGKTYRTVTDTHPGRTIAVRVVVEPAERSGVAYRY